MQAPAEIPYTLSQRIGDVQLQLVNIAKWHSPVALASSLAVEDMVLTDMILRAGLPIGIFTLDTGRLHAETLAVVDAVKERYKFSIEIYRPQPAAVEQYVNQHGANAFYESVELRKACCQIRKVEPLKRALTGKKAWITGQRKSQSITRNSLQTREWDEGNQIDKFNPLAEWSDGDIWQYIRAFNVPYNALHDRGYPSIGCDPCTRAIKPGEDVRAGRWWWEQADSKECGLHMTPIKPI